MSSALKDIYNKQFFDEFTGVCVSVVKGFDKQVFLDQIYCDNWINLELKERMHHISSIIRSFLHQDYDQSIDQVLKIVDYYIENEIYDKGLELMFIPDYVEVYGMEDCDLAIKAFEKITQLTSCEFAIRPFIIRYEAKMLAQLLTWTKHTHYTVRRLASEGSRPRLPWAMALPSFKNDPSPIMSILEELKDDCSEIVRRSVANNLNDISKDNPEITINFAYKYKNRSEQLDRLLKHSCRTLLKQGHPKVMQLFGFGSTEAVSISDFVVHTPKIVIGESLEFGFLLQNKSSIAQKLRIEYGIYYNKANNSLSKKVFKISERLLEADELITIQRKQSFRPITTRKFYSGMHRISIIINGIETEIKDFELQ